MTPEQNKAIVANYIEEAWNKRNWAVAEEVVAEDAVFHDQVREGGLPPGREGLRTVMKQFHSAIPDMTMNMDDLIAEGDRVVIRWSSHGTQTGDFNGIPPTNRRATMYGIAIVRMENGRIVEGWQEADRLGMVQELGIMPKKMMPRPVLKAVIAGQNVLGRMRRRSAGARS